MNRRASRKQIPISDDNLPWKRDLWGQPIPETPAGNLPWLYHTLDVSKGQRIPTDDLNLLLYGLWRRTANSAVIPTPPDAAFNFAGQRYELTREDLSRLQELVGAERRSLAERVMLNDRFANLAPDGKIALLKTVWEFGARRGNALFYRERGAGLAPKEAPAGFSR